MSLFGHDIFRRLIAMFYFIEAIQRSKTNSINRKYRIMIINILKNQSRRYYNNYIIKFIGFISIYYAINLNIILFFISYSNLYLASIDLL